MSSKLPSRSNSDRVPASTRETISHSTSRSESHASTPYDKHSTSLPWILHHILERKLSSELPLRIMFSFNAGEQLPTLKQAHHWWQFDPRGKLIIEFLSSLPQAAQSPTDLSHDSAPAEKAKQEEYRGSKWGKYDNPEFDPCSIDQFLDINHGLLFNIDLNGGPKAAQGSFPISLVEGVCLDTFPEKFEEVDFAHALTAMDYLRDLECTRRTALREAATFFGITTANWRNVLSENKDAYSWVESVQRQELEIESHYASLFVDLRIWIMVHELKSEPFYKPNVLAMLNTLFPPKIKYLPNDRIDIKALQKYRSTFYQYVQTVDAKGTAVMSDFVQQLLKPEAKHSWASARSHLERYINLASIMVQQSKDIRDNSSVRNSTTMSVPNSAISERPSTASSANTSVDTHIRSISDPTSPGIPVAAGILEAKQQRRNRVGTSADAALTTFQPISPSLAPPPLQTNFGTSQQMSRGKMQDQKVWYSALPSEIYPSIGKPPTRPVPPIPQGKAGLNSGNTTSLPIRSPDTGVSPAQSSSSLLDQTEANSARTSSILPPKLLTNPRVTTTTQAQVLSNSPLSTTVSPEDIAPILSNDESTTRPATPALNLKEIQSNTSSLDFLNRPYSEPVQPEPSLKKRTSTSSLFWRRKGLDVLTTKTDISATNTTTPSTSQNTEISPSQTELEASTLRGRLRKQKSQPSLPRAKSRTTSSDPLRSVKSTTTREPELMVNNLEPMMSGARNDLESETARLALKKKKSASSLFQTSLGRARGKLRSRKPSPKRPGFDVEQLIIQEYTPTYDLLAPETSFRVSPHLPSAPASPVEPDFPSEDSTQESSIRRTKSHDDKRPRRSAYHKPDDSSTLAAPDSLNLPRPHIDQTEIDELYQSLPDLPIVESTSLNQPVAPGLEEYREAHKRDLARRALIAKHRATQIDDEFERPRTPPAVPKVPHRQSNRLGEAGWLPFERPRATPPPRTPQASPRPVNVSRFSFD